MKTTSVQKRSDRPRGRLRRIFSLLLSAALVSIVISDRVVANVSSPYILIDPNDVPRGSVAVTLGTSKFVPALFGKGEPQLNHFYVRRIAATVELFRAGHLSRIIVSGACDSPDADEPAQMRDDLIQRGVPADIIILDRAGRRTLLSVERAAQLAPGLPIVFISQRFHVERAIYLARSRHIAATGYLAPDAPTPWHLKARLRETLSRTTALLVSCPGSSLNNL